MELEKGYELRQQSNILANHVAHQRYSHQSLRLISLRLSDGKWVHPAISFLLIQKIYTTSNHLKSIR